MSSCRALIRKHLALLKPGEICTTRDLLSYGRRTAVDGTTYQLVKEGYLTRLAFGVFVVTHTSNRSYTAEEVVARKALAFGKVLYTHAKNLTAQMGRPFRLFIQPAKDPVITSSPTASSTASSAPPPEPCEPPNASDSELESEQFFFSCQSSSSSFIFRRGIRAKIDMAMVRYCCAKLLKHGDSNVGKSIRALVALGWGQISRDIVAGMLRQLNFKEQAELRMANAWMPYWLSDLLITEQSAIASANRFRASRA